MALNELIKCITLQEDPSKTTHGYLTTNLPGKQLRFVLPEGTKCSDAALEETQLTLDAFLKQSPDLNNLSAYSVRMMLNEITGLGAVFPPLSFRVDLMGNTLVIS